MSSSAVVIELDDNSKEPPYVQLKLSVARLIADGAMGAGDALPPIRQLAGDLGLAANTVARAYRELEVEGLVRSSGRRGTVVAARAGRGGEQLRHRRVTDEFVAVLRAEGIDTVGILRLVNEALVR